jgi:hypothetical protein
VRRLLLFVDVAAIAAFVAIGRDTHDRADTLQGFVETAAPFLIAVAAGWLAARAWRDPVSVRVGVVVWAVTVVLGIVLRRAVFGDGIAAAFILVASAFLALFIVGWRAAAARLRS